MRLGAKSKLEWAGRFAEVDLSPIAIMDEYLPPSEGLGQSTTSKLIEVLKNASLDGKDVAIIANLIWNQSTAARIET